MNKKFFVFWAMLSVIAVLVFVSPSLPMLNQGKVDCSRYMDTTKLLHVVTKEYAQGHFDIKDANVLHSYFDGWGREIAYQEMNGVVRFYSYGRYPNGESDRIDLREVNKSSYCVK